MQINAQIQAFNTQISAETDRIKQVIASAKAELSGRDRAYRDKKLSLLPNSKKLMPI